MIAAMFCPFCTKPCANEYGFWVHARSAHGPALAMLRLMAKEHNKEDWEIEREEMVERIEQLEIELYGKPGWQAPRELKLTPQEEAFVACLLAHDGYRSKEFLFEAVQRGNAEDTKLVQVVACKVRQKLQPNGLDIETVWGAGYALTPQTRQRLLNWTSKAEAA
jgi:DNA-binding response OmpR family regulator